MKEIFYDWGGYNIELFHFLNQLGNKGKVPQIMHLISEVFNIENFVAYYLILTLYCYLKAKKNPEELVIIYKRLVHAGVCYAVFGLTYAALKFSVNMPRPFCSLSAHSFETILNTAHERCMSGFPSSHAGLALMFTILVWKYLGIISRTIAIAVVGVVAFSRIVLAMHYPADIVYSYLIVIAVLGLSRLIFRLFEHNIIKGIGKWVKRVIY